MSWTHHALSSFLFQTLLCFKLGVEHSIKGRRADIQRQMWARSQKFSAKGLVFLNRGDLERLQKQDEKYKVEFS